MATKTKTLAVDLGARMKHTSRELQYPVTFKELYGVCQSCVSRSPITHDSGVVGQEDGPVDGSGYLLGALNTQTHVTITVPHGNKYLEPELLASTILLSLLSKA